MLGAADLQERPHWAGFLKVPSLACQRGAGLLPGTACAAHTPRRWLQEAAVRPQELVLTLGSWHSPMNLIEEEFGVSPGLGFGGSGVVWRRCRP